MKAKRETNNTDWEERMISRIDHVSIAVRDQKKAEHFFVTFWEPLTVPGQAILQPVFSGRSFLLVICHGLKLYRLRMQEVF